MKDPKSMQRFGLAFLISSIVSTAVENGSSYLAIYLGIAKEKGKALFFVERFGPAIGFLIAFAVTVILVSLCYYLYIKRPAWDLLAEVSFYALGVFGFMNIPAAVHDTCVLLFSRSPIEPFLNLLKYVFGFYGLILSILISRRSTKNKVVPFSSNLTKILLAKA